jgi:nitrate/TMAO reductase-like tetraheme cytochrome c subunit
MNRVVLIETAFVVVTIVLAILVASRAELTRARGGKVFAFLALFILPTLAVWGGFSEQMQRAQSTSFCLSCHVMTEYGRSLYVNDPSYLPARHFQNIFVPRDRACYTCHTDYTMFGGVKSKMRGVRHIAVYYFGKVPKPEAIKLYERYNNRECLHCHLGARRYEEASEHHKDPNMLAQAASNQLSCMASNCHDIVHDVDTLKDASFWSSSK